MKTNEIVNEIARLVRQRDLSLKDPKETKELKSKKGISARNGRGDPDVHGAILCRLRCRGLGIREGAIHEGRAAESAREQGNYKMDDAMVESIAERIANTLV